MHNKKKQSTRKSNSGRILFFLLALTGALLLVTSEAQAQSKGKPSQSCKDVDVNVFVRDHMGDSVQSDGGGSYAGVVHCNNETNNFTLNTGTIRALRFVLSQLPGGEALASASLGVNLSDESGGAQMFTMQDGDTALAARMQFTFNAGDKKYFLSWGSRFEGTAPPLITRTATGWTIETTGTHTARLRECPSKGTCKNPVDQLVAAPAGLDLLALN